MSRLKEGFFLYSIASSGKLNIIPIAGNYIYKSGISQICKIAKLDVRRVGVTAREPRRKIEVLSKGKTALRDIK